MTGTSTTPQDLLYWLPIPLATGMWVTDSDGDLVKVADIAMTVTLEDGTTTTTPLIERDGGWRI